MSEKRKKTAYLIGTGPSLNKIDVSKLKNEDTITFNRAYVAFNDWGFEPTYYLSIDVADLYSTYKDINMLIEHSNIKKFFLPHLEHFENRFDEINFKRKDNVYFMDQPPPVEMVIEGKAVIGYINAFRCGVINEQENSVDVVFQSCAGLCGLKILYMMGYEEVALLGCDARYRIDTESQKSIIWDEYGCTSQADYDANHFRDDYFGKGQTFGRPNESEQIKNWGHAADEIEWMNFPFKVYSCSEGSNLNQFFPYIDFEDFLSGKRK